MESMESPTLARQSVSVDRSEFDRVELEAFVATCKRQRPTAWSRVEHLQKVCRDESPASAAGFERSRQTIRELTA